MFISNILRKFKSIFGSAEKPAETPAKRRNAANTPANGSPEKPRRNTAGAGKKDRPPRGKRDGAGRKNARTERPAEADAPERKKQEQVFQLPPVDDSWNPAEFDVPPAEGKVRFHDFNLPAPILHAVFDLGFKYCSPIQAKTLDKTMAGLNVAGKAQTGTGKTAAFLIAIIKRMLDSPEARPLKPGRPAALVIAPTRELVIQIERDAEALGKYCGLRALAVYGGADHEQQQRKLESAPLDLLAATPGRLLDFKRSRTVCLKGVRTLVIDEADRMLDMGFIPDVKKIIRELPDGASRQTLLFSATLNDDVMRLASQWMPDPINVSVDPEHGTVDTIRQIVYPISSREKFTVLYNIIASGKYKRILVFRNRKRDCEDLARMLIEHGIAAELLSGDVEQKKRMRILDEFRAGKINLVVATDVAGRGIHVDDISLVVNYDFPYEADDYIHRIGRTGRAGTHGTACSFACEDESFIIPEIEKLLGEELHCQQPADALFTEVPPSVKKIPADRKNPAGKPMRRSSRRGQSDKTLKVRRIP